MEYLSILAIALSSCLSFVLGLGCAYWFYRSTLSQTKSALGDKTIVANLLGEELNKKKNGKSKKKYYNRKNNRSKSSGKKLQA